MSNLIFPVLFLLQNYLFIAYLFLNIKNFGEVGVASLHILLFYIISFIIIIFVLLNKYLHATKSSLILISIILWVGIKILVDVGDFEFFKQSIFATTGGILFFLLSGLSLYFSYLEIIDRHFTQNRATKILLIIFFLLTYCYIDLFLTLKLKLRDDIFLIEGLNGNYQRPGNFLSILFLLTSYIYVLLKLNILIRFKKIAFEFILNFIYIILLFIASVSTQMMGSNNAFVVISGSGIITLIFTSVVSSKNYTKNKNILNIKIIKLFIKKSFIYSLALFLFASTLLFIFDFDINSTRFVGYGAQSNTSLDSRLLILSKNFIIHFEDSPILGNFNIDEETTGVGTYVHSFFLYALTHTGFIGFIGFIVFFFYMFSLLLNRHISILFYNAPPSSHEKSIRLYSLCILSFLLLIANVGTTITWAVLWFAIGYMGQIFMARGSYK